MVGGMQRTIIRAAQEGAERKSCWVLEGERGKLGGPRASGTASQAATVPVINSDEII